MGGDHRTAAIEAQADTILSLLAEQPDATLVEYQAPWILERSATRLGEADLNILSKLGKQGLE